MITATTTSTVQLAVPTALIVIVLAVLLIVVGLRAMLAALLLIVIIWLAYTGRLTPVIDAAGPMLRRAAHNIAAAWYWLQAHST